VIHTTQSGSSGRIRVASLPGGPPARSRVRV
jgi:hypothetical protein